MELKIEATGRGDSRRIRLTGDSQAFFWLLSAAGNAMNGQVGNEAHIEGGGLIELVPKDVAAAQARGKTAHLKTNLAG